MSGDTVADPSGPLSWRDVYRAVGESEQRIIGALNAAVLPLTKAQADHEARLRAVEAASTAIPTMKVEETALTLRVTALEQHNIREQGVFATFGAGRTFILAIAAVSGPILAIVALVSR
jgi:hypothetical protein